LIEISLVISRKYGGVDGVVENLGAEKVWWSK
jgi:hypothetical protein